ncbi:hypothetical protein [Dyadobacter bucti]|nr:hypothetical protein [Dyadobacter bucti]
MAKEATRDHDWLNDAFAKKLPEITQPANDNCQPFVAKRFEMRRVG